MKATKRNMGRQKRDGVWLGCVLSLAWFLLGAMGDGATTVHARDWTGNSTNLVKYWSDPKNWDPQGVPQNGEDLNFSTICLVFCTPDDMHNDLTNLTVRSLSFYAVTAGDFGWDIYGNTLGISGGIYNTRTFDSQVYIHCGLKLGGNVTIETGGDEPGSHFVREEQAIFLRGPVDLNGYRLLLQSNGEYKEEGHLNVEGGITGNGTVVARTRSFFGDPSYLEFRNSGNSFSGTLILDPSDNTEIAFNVSSGVVVTDRLVVTNVGAVKLLRSHQIGDNATVRLSDGGTLQLLVYNDTIGNLELFTGADDSLPPILNTGIGTLSLQGNITSTCNKSGQTPVIMGRLNLLSGEHGFNVGGTVYAGLDMQAQVSGFGTITKSGNAALLLQASNSFNSSISILTGILDVRNDHGLGDVAGSTAIFAGGLTLRNANVGDELLFAIGTGTGGDLPGSVLTSVGLSSWSGQVQLDTNLVVAGDMTFSGPISGPGGLGCFGVGTIRLGGALANTFTGPTLARCPLLEFNKPYGVSAFAGPLVVGSTVSGPYEARWLNSYQNAGTSLTLYANGLVNLNGHIERFANVTFNGGQIDTGPFGQFNLGNPLTSAPSYLTVNSASSPATINGYFNPSGGPAWFTVADGSAEPDLLINAAVIGVAPQLIKQGPGTLKLTGANTYTGVTIINEGILEAAQNAALGSANFGTIVNDGTTLRLSGGDTMPEGMALQGAGYGGTNGVLQVTGSTTLTGSLFLNGPSTIHVAQSGGLVIDSVISGTGPLTKSGAGNLFLGGGSGTANTFTGDTLVNEGLLVLFKPAFVQAVPGNLVVGAPVQGVIAPTALARYFNADQVWANITVNRGGLVDLNGFDEYSGDVTLNNGGDIQTGAGTLFLGAGVNLYVSPGNNGASSISGRLQVSSGCTFSVGSRLLPVFNAAPELEVSAIISDPINTQTIYKTGSGELRLSGANTFRANLFISDGRVTVANSLGLGASSNQRGVSATTVNGNGSLALDGGVILNDSLTLDSTNVLVVQSLTGSNTWTGPISLSRPTTVAVTAPNGYLQIVNQVTGAGGLTKLGPGTLQFWGTAANAYVGLTIVAEGIIEARRTGQISIPGDAIIGDDSTGTTTARILMQREQQFPRTANVTIRRSGLLHLFPLSAMPLPTPTLRSVTGRGQIQIINAGSSLTISNDLDCEFAGSILGNGALNKTGPGTLRVTGDGTLNGPTTISGGTYWLDGIMDGSPVTVGLNATLRGDGSAGNVTTTGLDSRVFVDSKIPARQGGDLEMASLSFAAGSVAVFDFFGPSPTGGNDGLVAHGSVTLNDAGLGYSFSYPPRENDVLTVLRKESAGAINGTFGGWPEGITRNIGGVTVRATYLGGNGNDFTLTVTNLPVTRAGVRLVEGNGNQTVEPDECNLLYLSVTNRRGTSLTITSAVLRATLPGALVTIASASYPVIPAGAVRENLTPFQFRTSPTMPCGALVNFELVLGVAGEGLFGVTFNPQTGLDCTHPTGGCESCFVVSGQFTTNTPTLLRSLNFVGGPSLCFPTKSCPVTNFFSDTVAVPYLTHPFTNSSTNELCLTAQLHLDCPGAPTNALGAAAYLGNNIVDNPCGHYLGDTGADGTQPFSFRVPANTNFIILVSARDTNLGCDRYTLELFGLPCPPPMLHIVKDATAGKALLRWSTAYPGWTLQSANPLTGSAPYLFADTISTPVIHSAQFTVTNGMTNSVQIHRLKK